MNRQGFGAGPVDVLQQVSLDALIEAMRRQGIIPPGDNRGDEEAPVVLVAPAIEAIDVALLEGSSGGSATTSAFPDATTTYAPERMVDVRLGLRLLFICRSSLNQAVTMQVFGMETDSPSNAGGRISIGSSEVLAASTGRIGFAVNLDNAPYPYIGVTLATGAAAPTAGAASIRAYGLRWRLPRGSF